MKKIWIAAAAALLICASAQADNRQGFSWKELKGDHFILYYVSDENFAKETLRYAETYYTKIADDLGYTRFNYWNWDNRVKIYIYPDSASYIKSTGQAEWSKGVADYTDKSISSFNSNVEFQQSVLPHETAHLIFRDFVGFKGQVPLWLDEGVAQWQEPKKREMARDAGYTVLLKKGVYPFREFTQIYDFNKQTELEIQYFYMQAASVVDYMVKTYGSTQFTEFCRQLRDGKSMDDALRGTYGPSIPSLFDLEQKWLKYVNPNAA